jgi:hypothetical protein
LTATGLSSNKQEYRQRLDDQPDERIDGWAAELMRDMSIRVGVRKVLAELRHSFKVDDAALARIFTAGGGPAAAVGKTADGELMVPAISLRFLVPGAHALLPAARAKLIEYLVESFDELVYI